MTENMSQDRTTAWNRLSREIHGLQEEGVSGLPGLQATTDSFLWKRKWSRRLAPHSSHPSFLCSIPAIGLVPASLPGDASLCLVGVEEACVTEEDSSGLN